MQNNSQISGVCFRSSLQSWNPMTVDKIMFCLGYLHANGNTVSILNADYHTKLK